MEVVLVDHFPLKAHKSQSQSSQKLFVSCVEGWGHFIRGAEEERRFLGGEISHLHLCGRTAGWRDCPNSSCFDYIVCVLALLRTCQKKKEKTLTTPVFLLCVDLSAALDLPIGDRSLGTLLHQTSVGTLHAWGTPGAFLFCFPVNKIRVLFPLLLCTETDKILLRGEMGVGRTIDHCHNLTPEAILRFSQRQQIEGGLCSNPNVS